MRIVNLSYVSIGDFHEPESWLKRINYFTGILEEMTQYATVINFHSIQYHGVITRNGVEYHFTPLSIRERWFPFAFHSYILGLKPDVIIVHGLLFPWQVFLLQRRLGRHVRLFIQHHAERPSTGWRKFFQKKNDSGVQGYFFCAKDLGLDWVRNGLISNPLKIHEVMEISSVFSPIERSLATSQTSVTGLPAYLWVGGLLANKDPFTLINAFSSFLKTRPEATLYMIYQSDELIEEVQEIIGNFPHSKKNIHLVGRISHDEMVKWYSSVDFIIATSHYEAGGASVCEAISCGCIPILSDIPSFRMMTANGTIGLLFPAGDSLILAECLEKSIDLDRSRMREMLHEQFHNQLSFKAIGKKIWDTIQ